MNVGRTVTSERSFHMSRKQPITLDDLEGHREAMLRSGDKATRILVQKVADMQNQLETYQLTPAEHQELCHVVLEAAAMLNGSSDVDEEVLTRAGLADLGSDERCISQAVYLGIADDLKVQLDEFRGVVAKRPPAPDPEHAPHPFPSLLLGGPGLGGIVIEGLDGTIPDAFRALAGIPDWASLLAPQAQLSMIHESVASLIHPSGSGIAPERQRFDAPQTQERNLDRPPVHSQRADAATMNQASQALANGVSVPEVIQRFNLFNAEDFQQIHDVARDLALTHLGQML